ncbi:hypothetical protein J6590_088534 [Homalodisca vitripennis]|nr:hypothetical protein J6590_088534 [Homalodisca vitripennis]
MFVACLNMKEVCIMTLSDTNRRESPLEHNHKVRVQHDECLASPLTPRVHISIIFYRLVTYETDLLGIIVAHTCCLSCGFSRHPHDLS